ncbi:MAG: response regulator [Verrucomicrobia bacterium]|nr:response regulator [Verrucomicrobiota bacterium]
MKSILLIDDDGALSVALSQPLKEAGWAVHYTRGGEEGVRLAVEKSPDVIVCEVLMPRFNGFQVCRAIQARRDVLPRTKIVVTGSSSYSTDRNNALEAGADEYLVKPFKPAELFTLLDKIGADTAYFRAGRDDLKKQPRRGDTEIEPMVYQLGRPPTVRFWGVRGSLPMPSSQMESPYFPISMQQMPSHLHVEEIKNMEFNIGAVKVKATFLNHPGICIGYRLETSGGSVCYLPDNEPYSRLRTTPGATAAQSYDNLSYAQQQDEKLIDFIRDADVLVMDAQYDATEYKSHVGWGHGCVDDVVALAVVANVKKLFLFHHDPDHDDAHVTKMAEWARELAVMHGAMLEVEAAREGLEVVLDHKPA